MQTGQMRTKTRTDLTYKRGQTREHVKDDKAHVGDLFGRAELSDEC